MRGAVPPHASLPDQGCVLRPSFSIHTMFMQFPIDVVFLDQDLKVLKILRQRAALPHGFLPRCP